MNSSPNVTVEEKADQEAPPRQPVFARAIQFISMHLNRVQMAIANSNARRRDKNAHKKSERASKASKADKKAKKKSAKREKLAEAKSHSVSSTDVLEPTEDVTGTTGWVAAEYRNDEAVGLDEGKRTLANVDTATSLGTLPGNTVEFQLLPFFTDPDSSFDMGEPGSILSLENMDGDENSKSQTVFGSSDSSKDYTLDRELEEFSKIAEQDHHSSFFGTGDEGNDHFLGFDDNSWLVKETVGDIATVDSEPRPFFDGDDSEHGLFDSLGSLEGLDYEEPENCQGRELEGFFGCMDQEDEKSENCQGRELEGFFGFMDQEDEQCIDDISAFSTVSCTTLVLYTGPAGSDSETAAFTFSDEELSTPLGKHYSRLRELFDTGCLSTVLELDDVSDNVQAAFRKMSLYLHPDRNLKQKVLAEAAFVIIKDCTMSLTKTIPNALTALETFKTHINDINPVGVSSISGLLSAIIPLARDPLGKKMLKRAYRIALATGNIMSFYDQAMTVSTGKLAALLADIQSSLFVDREDIAEGLLPINERLMYLSPDSYCKTTKDALILAYCDSDCHGIFLFR
jgi:hypothetical protein